MANSLNTFLSLYRLIRKQRYATIAPQLEQLSDLITQSINAIAQQEQVLLRIENATLGCVEYRLSTDARELLTTDDFRAFLEKFIADEAVRNLPPEAKVVMINEPDQWQLKTLPVPLQIKRHQVVMEPRYAYRLKFQLGNWQQSLEGAIVTNDSIPHQIESHLSQWTEVLEQLQDAESQLDLDPSQQIQLRYELSLLIVYILSLICIHPLSPEFTYP